jgi:hypothetical protein
VALAAIWAIAFSVLLAWGLYAQASAASDTTDCQKAGPVSGVPSAAPSKPPQLKPRAAPVTSVPFSRSRTIQFRQVLYDVTDPGRVLANVHQLDVFTGQFISSDGSQQINPRDISATAAFHSGQVVLDVCLLSVRTPPMGVWRHSIK